MIIGFDLRDPLHPYLLIKNSWGKNWGEGGHCRIEIIDDLMGGNELAVVSSRKPVGVLDIEKIAWRVVIC